MKVSIIIPIYNVEKEIERCLISVLKQDYANIELVLVNDDTPDQSFNIAKNLLQFQQLNKNIILIEHKKNMGLSCARNSGIRQSSGDYLFFLDSDDELASECAISTLINIVESQKILPEIVVGNRWIERDMSVPEMKVASYNSNQEVYEAYLQSKFSVIMCAKLIERKFLVDNQLYLMPGIYHEDDLWWFQVCRRASQIYVTDQVICNFYARDESITAEVTPKHAKDWVTIVLEMAEIYMQDPNYFGRKTILWIEAVKYKCIKRLYLFNDDAFIKGQLKRLQAIKLPIFRNGNIRVIRRNLIMQLPTNFVFLYLKMKFKPK